ncbi:MAG: hypothetical protein MJZ82_02740 [Paludibacteraceae bacterium]|nr:hypothetical protein [Paludibacteraceae bacterium]
MERFDKYWIGIIIGLVLPGLFAIIYIDHYNLWYPLQTFQFGLGSMLNKLLQVCVFPDLALLFVFYTTDTWRLAKGVLIGSFPYILAAIAFTI